jgi:hypothetical protein
MHYRTIVAAALGVLLGIAGTLTYVRAHAVPTPLSVQDILDQLHADVEARKAAWPVSGAIELDRLTSRENGDYVIEHTWRPCVISRLDHGQALATAEERCGDTPGYHRRAGG